MSSRSNYATDPRTFIINLPFAVAVSNCIDRIQTCLLRLDALRDLDQVRHRAGETIELCHNDDIALTNVVEQSFELGGALGDRRNLRGTRQDLDYVRWQCSTSPSQPPLWLSHKAIPPPSG
jgi:hypothetical protein